MDSDAAAQIHAGLDWITATYGTLPYDLAGVTAVMGQIAAARKQGPGSGNRGNAEVLRRHWTEGPGAAKIRWGQPGDFDRCVKEMVDDAKMTPEQAKGYCNLLHHRALGFYPATHKKMEHAGLSAADGTSGGETGTTTSGGETGSTTAPALPALITIPGVDLLAAGTWNLSTGRQTFTRGDLESAVQAATCPAVGAPLIKIGHLDQRFTPQPGQDGEPAIGKVANMRLDPAGHKIIGDLTGMPGWLGAITASAFPRRSVEGKYRFKCQIGHDHPFIITALALLGVTPPGVGVLSGLDDIATLYGLTASAGEPWRTEPAEPEETLMPAVTEEDVRRAYYANAGAPQTWWITELHMAPTQLIVADEADGRIYRVPFQIEGSAVEFGDPDEVASYEDVAASRGTGPVMVYATAEESRWVTAQADAGSQDTQDEGTADTGTDTGSTDSDGLDASWDGSLDGLPDLDGITIADLEAALAAETGTTAATADEDILVFETEEARGLVTVEAAAKLGTGARFAALKSKLAGKGATNPGALAAWIGRKKFGKAKFASLAKRARKKAAAAGDVSAADGSHGPYTGEHSHAHTTYGTQGGDETHEHMHRHQGDGVHQHAHDPVSSAAEAAATTQQGGHSDMEFTNAQMAAIRQRLGKNDTDPVTTAEVMSIIDMPRAPSIAAAAGAPGDGSVEVPQIGDGTYLVDGEILRHYQEQALAGARAVRSLHVAERDTILASAVKDGKFGQARLEHFKALWDRDPDGTRTLVSQLAPNLVPMAAVGSNGDFSADPDLPGDFDAQQAYRTLYGEEEKTARARIGR